jgi:hypothetical protein
MQLGGTSFCMGDEFVYRGNLAETPLPEMLATIHRYGVPGEMEFATGGDTRRVFFLDGDVIFATSSDRSESLGDFLLTKGKISQGQYNVSVAMLKRSRGKRHGTILVEMGFLKDEELGMAVREQVMTILWQLFNLTESTVTFKVGKFRSDEDIQIKIPTPRVILSGCKRISDAKAVTSRLGGKHTVFHKRECPEHLASLTFEAGEQQLLELVNGKRTLLELCAEGPHKPGLNARALYAFVVLGLVEGLERSGIRIHVPSSE